MNPPKPLRARYWKINRLVEQLLSSNDVTSPPVPVERMVKRSGINLVRGDLGEVSGLLLRRSDELVIGTNKTQSPSRQRFTIAHEFGHYILHEGISAHFDRDFRVNYRSTESSQATDVEEIEANYFAASILMPEKFLLEDNAIEYLDSDKGVAFLAKRYAVSRHAMSLRLVNIFGNHRPF